MRAATGPSENLSSGPSLGRPRCEHIATLAPLSRRYLTVGTDARMRVSSPMTPSLMGTLRSQRMRTFLPLRSASLKSATDFLASSSTGARTAALLTGAKAPAQESARARMTAFIFVFAAGGRGRYEFVRKTAAPPRGALARFLLRSEAPPRGALLFWCVSIQR